MDIVVRQGIAGVDAEGGVLAILGSDGVVTPVVTVGYEPQHLAAFGRLTLEDGFPLTAAIRHSVPIFISSRDDVLEQFPAMATVPSRSRAWAVVPLTARDVTFGALGVSFASSHRFDELDRLFLGALADITALSLTSADAEAVAASAEAGARADLALVQKVLIYLFEISLRLASLASDPRVGSESQARLQGVVDDLDAFGAECRRSLYTSDFSEPSSAPAREFPHPPRSTRSR